MFDVDAALGRSAVLGLGAAFLKTPDKAACACLAPMPFSIEQREILFDVDAAWGRRAALGRGGAFLKAPDEADCFTPWPFSLEPREILFLFIWFSDFATTM